MKCKFFPFAVFADGEIERKAADLFAEEIELRTGKRPEINPEGFSGKRITFASDGYSEDEGFRIIQSEDEIRISASRLRGFIYGYSHILKKSVIEKGELYLTCSVACSKTPSFGIRGHQLSYRHMNNTYDAWDLSTYERYIRDLMFFGTNMIEGDSGIDHERNPLMKMSGKEAIEGVSAICKKLDLDFSVFHPLSKSDTDEEALDYVRDVYSDIPEFSVIFPPGGDPGDLTAGAFAERCKKIKKELVKKYPDIELWPSAQAPHQYPDWGEEFLNELRAKPAEFDGVIFGPNHPMTLDELRRGAPLGYPIRFYPDITHNVRCETPVHFKRNDWHYAFAATLSRESVNPRPREYRLFHKLMRSYVCGTVTYSEGVNDDLNKMIWGDMDFDFSVQLRESVADYARVFFPGSDCEKIADLIFCLELGWEGDPAENPLIDLTFRGFGELKDSDPPLMGNWRFVLLLFRAACDEYVRKRRIFELDLISEASSSVASGDVDGAERILRTDLPEELRLLRASLFDYAETAFRLIGIQLDVEHFYGMNPERGCTLDTIDEPVTDRLWLLEKFADERSRSSIEKYFRRNSVENDEYYFSFAEDGFGVCGEQDGEYYFDFYGDRNPDGKIPTCISRLYDHFNFKISAAGLTGGDYTLKITYRPRRTQGKEHLTISVNHRIIYEGEPYGGRRDAEYERDFLPDGFICVDYDIKAEYIENGCVLLEMNEPVRGFMISELRFVKSERG